ncbi:hypothetical protein T03_17274 [Trichinella britovi]|uniref:Uncharacterized protein n=1 Tax=Trichinella britovi TaxID=45882 RepID=A0A0V0ZMZ3_TRIBR|nr:hypothetical protein T03_17274 [Trichinella britovi]
MLWQHFQFPGYKCRENAQLTNCSQLQLSSLTKE